MHIFTSVTRLLIVLAISTSPVHAGWILQPYGGQYNVLGGTDQHTNATSSIFGFECTGKHLSEKGFRSAFVLQTSINAKNGSEVVVKIDNQIPFKFKIWTDKDSMAIQIPEEKWFFFIDSLKLGRNLFMEHQKENDVRAWLNVNLLGFTKVYESCPSI